MRKKRISLLLVFAMLLSMLPVNVAANGEEEGPAAPAESANFGVYKVTLDAKSVVTVNGTKDITKVELVTYSSGENTFDTYELSMDTDPENSNPTDVTVYENAKDTKIKLTGGGAKYYDVKIGTGDKENTLELNEESFEGVIDLPSNAEEVTPEGGTKTYSVQITITGKPSEKINAIECDKDIDDSAGKDFNCYKIKADSETVGTTDGLKAYVVAKDNVTEIETKVAGLKKNMTEAEVKTALGLGEDYTSVTNVSYKNNEDTLVVVKYADNRVVKAGSAVIDIDEPATSGPVDPPIEDKKTVTFEYTDKAKEAGVTGGAVSENMEQADPAVLTYTVKDDADVTFVVTKPTDETKWALKVSAEKDGASIGEKLSSKPNESAPNSVTYTISKDALVAGKTIAVTVDAEPVESETPA